MKFPLPTPDEKTIAFMEKTWARHHLEGYLKRWENAFVPPAPDAFWDFDWRACDVGCGFGKYLLARSEAHPEKGWLGIDKGNLRGGSMVERFEETKRKNLFGVHGNAIPIMAKFPDRSLDEITLFYPNPWWPAKHRKKRWSYHPLLPKICRLLKPGGVLLLTSNEDFYLGEWRYALMHHPHIEGMEEVYSGPIRDDQGRSHFETKFISQGVPCGEVAFRYSG